MSEDDRVRLFQAFIAGFRCSGEGYNAEYPFAFDDEKIRDELSDKFEEWHSEANTDRSEADRDV